MEQIFYNGKIITMCAVDEAQERSIEPEAVLIENGKIKMTGKLSDIEECADASAQRRNLEGKCLMPAFIDAHSHFVMNGQMSAMADLSDCACFDDVISVLKKYIAVNNLTKKEVVLGFGYDHNFLKEYAHPDKRVLDQVSLEIPIVVLHISAHLACANTAALRLAGIDENTNDPDGGIFGRFQNSREPSGYAEESAVGLLQAAVIPRIKFDIASVMQNMQAEYLKNGVTTVQDGASTQKDVEMLIQMNDAGCLKLDVISYPLITADGEQTMSLYGKDYCDYRNHFKIGGYKVVLDGSPQGRSAWMSEPYLGGEPDYCGYPWLKDDILYEYIRRAMHENRQILAHCNGDAASGQFIAAYESALRNTDNKKDLRPVMIHCQTVRNDQLDRMAKISMIASVFVGHVWYWGDVHMRNFGAERGNRISPVKDALNRGICVNFHQDTPVTKPDMLHSVWCAVNRVSRSGCKIGENQAIDVYDALKAVTVNAAYQYFEENTKGSISTGKRADLVILDKSPLDVDKMEIKEINVLETIKDGETVYRRN